MGADFWETHLWQWATLDQLVVIAFSLATGFGALVVRYARTKRWDRAWKDRWEQRHGKSLEVLRRNKQRSLKMMMVVLWIILAVFVMGLGASFEPVAGMINGRRLPSILIEALVTINLAFLLALVGIFATVRLGKFELKRIDELLAAESISKHS